MALTIEGLLLKIRQRKLVVIAVPLLAGIYLAMLFISRPMNVRMGQIRDEHAVLAEKASVMTELMMAEGKISSYRKRLAVIEERSKLIEALNVLASKAGLTISSVTPQEKMPQGMFLEKIQVRIEAEGNYHQLGEFAASVENLEQLAKILYVEVNVESPENVGLASRLGLNPNGSIKSGQLRSYKMSIDIGFFSLQPGVL